MAVSNPNGSLSSITNYPFKGAYNIINGLSNWRNSWGLTAKDSAGTGAGGIDVIFACDSIGEGANGTNPAYDSFHHGVRLSLQAALNPSDVVGGYGLMSAQCGYYSANNAPSY